MWPGGNSNFENGQIYSNKFSLITFRLRPSDVDVALLAYSHDLLSRLEQETGVDPGYIVNGGLFIASTKVINFPVQVNLIEIIHLIEGATE